MARPLGASGVMGMTVGRVWLVTTELYPFSGGIGVYAHHAGVMLAQAGVEVSILLHDPGLTAPIVRRTHGYRLIRFCRQTLHHRPTSQAELQGPLGVAYQACEFLKHLVTEEGAPDVIEFQDYGALGYFFLKHRLMEMGDEAPRVVLTAHRPYVHCAAADGESTFEHRTAFLGDAERWCYAAADAVLAPCRYIVEALRRPDMAFPLHDVHVVGNPFDPKVIARAIPDDLVAPQVKALEASQYGPDEPVLYFGKLQNQKGAWDLIASLAALWAQDQTHPLWMWGRDAMHSPSGTTTYDFLEHRYRRLFARNLVRYFGPYALGALRALCASHPICVVPFREECLPYAFIEIVLCGGIPIWAADGGQSEIVPPAYRKLLIVDFNSPQDLGETLRALKALTPAERQSLSLALAAEVRAQTDYKTVAARKLEALSRVALSSIRRDYPFVHGDAKTFATLTIEDRARLTSAVPQRGATISTIVSPGAPAQRRGGLISVIVPYFEMHDYIEETLEAIETQAHPAVEIIIVDDGSHSEAAKARLNAIAARPSRFRTTVLRKYNGGLSDARNAGARIAQGDYLYFLDADDLIHPATLTKGLSVLQRFDNVAYVGAWLREFEGGEREWLVWDIDGPYIGFHNLQICSFLVRAQAWLTYGVNDPAMALGMEDYESHVRMFAAGVRGVALPRAFFNYRIRKDSMARAFNAHTQAFLQRRVIANNRDVYTRYGAQLAGMFAENGHGAVATAPTRETPAHAALLSLDIPSLEDVDHELERHASRDRLGRALRARAHHGGPAWDYTVGRLLLALDLAPEWARRSLSRAADQTPDNGWYRLYAIVAHARAEDDEAAQAAWSTDFASFCHREHGAVRWVAGLEHVRGFPRASLRLCAGLGLASPGSEVRFGGDADPVFSEVHLALDRLKTALAAAGLADVRGAARALYDTAERVVSPQAATALLNRWLLNWRGLNVVEAAAFRRLAGAVDDDLGARVFAGLSGEAEWLDVMGQRCADLEPRRDMAGSPAEPPRPQRSLLQRVLTRL
jgi:glycosyltransferase involved in cell wall biosynthesis/GT2 family glycosyltransferase